MGILSGSVLIGDHNFAVRRVLNCNGLVYAIDGNGDLRKQSLSDLDLSLSTAQAGNWDLIDINPIDVYTEKFNFVTKQANTVIAVGADSVIRTNSNQIDWVKGLGIAYKNTWGSLVWAAGNDSYVIAVGDHGAIALRSYDSVGSFYNWQLLGANGYPTTAQLNTVVNPVGTNSFLIGGQQGTLLYCQNISQSYQFTTVTIDDPSGEIDPITKKVRQVNFTNNDILELAHNGQYYLALTIDRGNQQYVIYQSNTEIGSSWAAVYTTANKLSSLTWVPNLNSWLVINQTSNLLLSSSNGVSWANEDLSAGIFTDAELSCFFINDHYLYLFSTSKIVLIDYVPLQLQPVIQPSATEINFGGVAANVTSNQSLAISNVGTENLVIGQLSITGNNAAYFSYQGCANTVVASGEVCLSTITFSPDVDVVNASAELTISHNAAGSPAVIPLYGFRARPVISVLTSEIDFGELPIGQSNFGAVSVFNSGLVDLSLTRIHIEPESSSMFNIIPTDLTALSGNLGYAAEVGPGRIKGFVVSFSPADIYEHHANVVIEHNDTTAENITVPILGKGQVYELEIDTELITISNVALGTTGNANVTAINSSTGNITIFSLPITGANVANLSANGCLSTLMPGEVCTITVEYSPTEVESISANLVITHTGTNNPKTVAIVANSVGE